MILCIMQKYIWITLSAWDSKFRKHWYLQKKKKITEKSHCYMQSESKIERETVSYSNIYTSLNSFLPQEGGRKWILWPSDWCHFLRTNSVGRLGSQFLPWTGKNPGIYLDLNPCFQIRMGIDSGWSKNKRETKKRYATSPTLKFVIIKTFRR